ncbi:MAG: DUF951 domain-containing protein [Bacillota bacterium]|nr:DUF951 domain-containing protein [Bacillota bacterium]
MGRKEFHLGDIVKMKKQHPCGSYEWEVVRMGADIKIKCQGCSRVVMLPRSEFEKKMVRVVISSASNDKNQS